MSIEQHKLEVMGCLEDLEDWDERYLWLIDQGKTLVLLAERHKTTGNKVLGCTSRVWITGDLNSRNQVILQGDSDSQIVKGLLAILLKIYSHSTPSEILSDKSNLITELHLTKGLMPSRIIGFEAMQKKIYQIAKSLT